MKKFKKPEHFLYHEAGLPDRFWEYDALPRFKTVTKDGKTKSDVQDCESQANAYYSLLHKPRQLVTMPRRWRLGAYSTPIDYAVLTVALIVKEAIRSRIRVQCVSPENLGKVHESKTDLVFCYGIYSDAAIEDLMAVRNAHYRNFHLFYVMDGNFQIAIDALKISPDYCFQVDSCAISLTEKVI